MKLTVMTRPYLPTDSGFVYDSWIKSMADDIGVDDPEQRTRFWRAQKANIKQALAGSTTLVAHPPGEPGVIYGWICFAAPDAIHFVYTRKEHRRFEIARQLIGAAALGRNIRATHHTSWGLRRLRHLFESVSLDPFVGEP